MVGFNIEDKVVKKIDSILDSNTSCEEDCSRQHTLQNEKRPIDHLLMNVPNKTSLFQANSASRAEKKPNGKKYIDLYDKEQMTTNKKRMSH